MIWAFFPVRDVLNSDIMICLRIDINLILTTRHFSYLLVACLVTCFVCHLSMFFNLSWWRMCISIRVGSICTELCAKLWCWQEMDKSNISPFLFYFLLEMSRDCVYQCCAIVSALFLLKEFFARLIWKTWVVALHTNFWNANRCLSQNIDLAVEFFS